MSESRGAVAEERSAFARPDASTSPPPASASEDLAGGRLGPEIEAVIGRRLKALYDDVVSEPVPDRFLQLLAKLEAPPAAADPLKTTPDETTPDETTPGGAGKVDR